MSPRIDHRPPIIAFVFLVVLAVAVIGTSAKGADGNVFLAGPLGAHTHISGKAGAAVERRPAAVREVQPSRSQPRVRATAERSERAEAARQRSKAPVERPEQARAVGRVLVVALRYDGVTTASKHGPKRGWWKIVSQRSRGR